ncbi:hypothetical protein D6833_04760, partial [Candidatus Parcubacteria bacterium]
MRVKNKDKQEPSDDLQQILKNVAALLQKRLAEDRRKSAATVKREGYSGNYSYYKAEYASALREVIDRVLHSRAPIELPRRDLKESTFNQMIYHARRYLIEKLAPEYEQLLTLVRFKRTNRGVI